MTPRQLKTLGELLYGRRWKTYLANDVGVDRRTVMCWAQKEWTMPAARAKAIMGWPASGSSPDLELAKEGGAILLMNERLRRK